MSIMGIAERRSDLRNIIIGYVKEQPQNGSPMKVLEFHFSEDGDYRPSWRNTSRVTSVKCMDGLWLFDVTTESGRNYIVEVMGR